MILMFVILIGGTFLALFILKRLVYKEQKIPKKIIIGMFGTIILIMLFIPIFTYISYSKTMNEMGLLNKTSIPKELSLNVTFNSFDDELRVMLTGAYDIGYIRPNRIYLVINGVQYGYKGFESRIYNFDLSNNDTIYRFRTYMFDQTARRSIEQKRKAELLIDYDNGIARGKVRYLNIETMEYDEGN